jgi:transcriptional regulator with XRE-family HTH domain
VQTDQSLGQALRSLRTKRKWSQTDLALRSDVDRNYISLIELGRNSPTVRLMFDLCDALDIAPSEFVKEVERRIRLQPRSSLNVPQLPPTSDIHSEN